MNALALGAPDMSACVLIDDSPSGLMSARSTGMWAVGIVASGNEVGLSLENWEALDDVQQELQREKVATVLEAAEAHYIIDPVIT